MLLVLFWTWGSGAHQRLVRISTATIILKKTHLFSQILKKQKQKKQKK